MTYKICRPKKEWQLNSCNYREEQKKEAKIKMTSNNLQSRGVNHLMSNYFSVFAAGWPANWMYKIIQNSDIHDMLSC